MLLGCGRRAGRRWESVQHHEASPLAKLEINLNGAEQTSIIFVGTRILQFALIFSLASHGICYLIM